MPLAKPPYPGYSWSLTQHSGPASQPAILFKLLEVASKFSESPNEINEYLASAGVLTPNIRGDRPQPWRDYQQILSELGLIVSTKLTSNKIFVTPLGLMWLDGTIGYSEVVSTQMLRYQYPNGHKQDISSPVKAQLNAAKIRLPDTRTELDAAFGVMVKPGVLILRIFVELLKRNDPNPRLSPKECLAALVPIYQNQQWEMAFEQLLQIRRHPIPSLEQRPLRHVQEWFRLLGQTDLFRLIGNSRSQFLELKTKKTQDIDALVSLCEFHENPSTFWTPQGESKERMGYSWFEFFGNPDVTSQWMLAISDLEPDYLVENYPAGVADLSEGQESEALWSKGPGINLREFDPSLLGSPTNVPSKLKKIDIKRIEMGHARRQKSTNLHERIVSWVAEKLLAGEYQIHDDPDSVDLLVEKNGKETIIEVKTISKRNLVPRLRLGVGQLSEYRYRRQIQTKNRPLSVLVVSSKLPSPEWLTEYFSSDVKHGLVSLESTNKFHAYTSGRIEQLLAS